MGIKVSAPPTADRLCWKQAPSSNQGTASSAMKEPTMAATACSSTPAKNARLCPGRTALYNPSAPRLLRLPATSTKLISFGVACVLSM